MIDPIQLKGIQLPQDLELSGKKTEAVEDPNAGSFSDMLSRAIRGVDETMKDSDQKVADFVTGKTENVHDVMISMQRAQLSFQLMVEVRNKAMDAYRELSTMQI